MALWEPPPHFWGPPSGYRRAAVPNYINRIMDYVIIVAGGKGLRMGGDVPKQFLPIGGQPVLMRTIRQFYDSPLGPSIILVLPHEQQPYWHDLCRQYGFDIPHQVVDGGATRFDSSRHGLQAIPADTHGLVGIHDGVRPFVSAQVIERCYAAARQHGAAIPVLPVTDTLRHIAASGDGHNVDRAGYRIVQTPQVFDIDLMRRAFAQPYRDQFTDDASVAEAIGCHVEMVEGNRENIKLTTPFDLKVAETLC